MAGLSIDIENALGVKYGDGPVATAATWRQSRRLSRAGTVAFTAPAVDARTAHVQLRRYMRSYAPVPTLGRISIGHGIIDQIDVDIDARTMAVSGDDLLVELAMRSVGFTALTGTGETPISVSDALDLILAACNAQADPDWTLDTSTYATTGSTTNGGATIEDVTNIESWVGHEGTSVFGVGIPAGAWLVAVEVADEELTISHNATITDTDVAIDRVQIYHVFAGESILQALIKVSELTGMPFRLNQDGAGNPDPESPRHIEWLYIVQPTSGVRAIAFVDPMATARYPNQCLIRELTYTQDSSGVISHIHPWGSGSGDARLGLANLDHATNPDPLITTRTVPDGYTLDLDTNVLSRDAAETDYGYSVRHQTFNDISPAVKPGEGNYNAALVAARNQLFDAAIEYLRTHSEPLLNYRLSVANLDTMLLPGETIRVIYRGFAGTLNEMTGIVTQYRWVDIDADLLVLETTTDIDSNGVRTPALVVSTVSRWPVTDQQLVAQLAQRVEQSQQHSQPVTQSVTTTSAQSITVTDAATNTQTTVLTLAHHTSGTPAASFGANLLVRLHSSTNTEQTALAVVTTWTTATDASRKARTRVFAYDTASREVLRLEASGTAAMIGVLGHAAQALPAAYTQSFSTASRTHAAYTADTESVAYTGAADGEAKLADINALRVAYENLRAAHESTAQVLNQLVDDLQGYGWVQ